MVFRKLSTDGSEQMCSLSLPQMCLPQIQVLETCTALPAGCALKLLVVSIWAFVMTRPGNEIPIY